MFINGGIAAGGLNTPVVVAVCPLINSISLHCICPPNTGRESYITRDGLCITNTQTPCGVAAAGEVVVVVVRVRVGVMGGQVGEG